MGPTIKKPSESLLKWKVAKLIYDQLRPETHWAGIHCPRRAVIGTKKRTAKRTILYTRMSLAVIKLTHVRRKGKFFFGKR